MTEVPISCFGYECYDSIYTFAADFTDVRNPVSQLTDQEVTGNDDRAFISGRYNVRHGASCAYDQPEYQGGRSPRKDPLSSRKTDRLIL